MLHILKFSVIFLLGNYIQIKTLSLKRFHKILHYHYVKTNKNNKYTP